MPIVYLFIHYLNGLGIKIDDDIVSAIDTNKYFSPLFDLLDSKKVMRDKNYWFVLKNDLRKKYNEIKHEIASDRVDKLLNNILEQAGVTINGETLYPLRNAMIDAVAYEQNVVYEEAIVEFCDYLYYAKKNSKKTPSSTPSDLSKKYIEEELWPTLTMRCAFKNFVDLCMHLSSVENKLLMEKLSAVVKDAVDEKRNEAEK